MVSHRCPLKRETMIRRRFRYPTFAIALPALLGLCLVSCAAPKSASDTAAQSSASSETTSAEVNDPTDASSEIANKTSTEIPADAEASELGASPESEPSTKVLEPSASGDAAEPKAANESKAVNESKAANANAAEQEAADIQIDDTVCGAGGQEAYFETKTQEIYICKNEEGALTYIATPKKKGNSAFLPAQKIQQGDVIGYAAIDDAKTYIVTPGGFQLQDNGKAIRSEKVTRRQLNQN